LGVSLSADEIDENRRDDMPCAGGVPRRGIPLA